MLLEAVSAAYPCRSALMELPLSYLSTRVTVEQAVSENTYDGRPFGSAEDDWLKLLAEHREGDELWNFEPPSRDVIQVWGVALVRDGRVISTVITAVD